MLMVFFMIERNASDLHLKAGRPPLIRVDGDLLQAAPDPVPAAEVEAMLMQIASPRAKRIFEERGECDFSFQAQTAAEFDSGEFT